MLSDKIKIEIGIKGNVISGDIPIELMLANISSESLNLSCHVSVEITGAVNGWAPINPNYHFSQPAFDSNPINFSLASGQNIFSQILLGKLFYSNNVGSSFPNLTWREFLVSKSDVRNDLEIHLVFDFVDSSGQTETVKSNAIQVKLDINTEDRHEIILNDINDISLLLKDFSRRLEQIEDKIDNNP